MTTELNQEIKPLTPEELAEARELDKVGIGRLWVAPDPFMEYGWAALLNRAPDVMETTAEVEEAFVAGSICSEHTASEDPDLAEKALGETFAKAEAIASAWNLRPKLIATIEAKDAMLAAIGKSHAETCDLAAKLSDERDALKERMEALEAVAEAVRIVKAHHDKPVPIGFNWAALNRAVWDALAALDAVRGGQA